MSTRSVKVLLVALAALGTVRAQDVLGADSLQNITIDKVPYIVALGDTSGFWHCAGALVAPRYVVTAAHCLYDYVAEPKGLRVIGGVSVRSQGEYRTVEKIIMHPEHNRVNHHMDIAVIKLDADMTGENIKPIAMCNKTLEETDVLQVSGWGLLDEEAMDLSEALATAYIPVLEQEECVQLHLLSDGSKITDEMLCSYAPGIDVHTFNAGGPGVIDEELCSVVSWGNAYRNGVYVRINAVRDFIEECMEGGSL